MGLLKLTNADIRADIVAFKERIQVAQAKLAAIPRGPMSYPIQKRIDKQRRELRADIKHIETLIGYAERALNNEQS